MTPAARVVFWARNERLEEEIVNEARKLAAMYDESPDDWFPWYVAAEAQLTAVRIERARQDVIKYYTEKNKLAGK